MKIALKVAYLGWNYSGFQKQPEKDTIESRLELALSKLSLLQKGEKILYSGRTDRGVNAIDQTICFFLSETRKAKSENLNQIINLKAINAYLPHDVFVWGKKIVHRDFNPRKDPIYREYSYLLPKTDYSLDNIIKACSLLEGVHDLFNFCKLKYKQEDTVRTIDEIEIDLSQQNRITILIRAKSFLWQQIRRMVTFIYLCGIGEIPIPSEKKIFQRSNIKFPPCDPYFLTLTRVKYQEEDYLLENVASVSRNLRNIKMKITKNSEGTNFYCWYEKKIKSYFEDKERDQ